MLGRITSKFGQQEAFRKAPHSGIDISAKEGEPLYSIKQGTIRMEDYGNVNAGKTVFVQWEDGKVSIYGHLSKFAENLKDGDVVQKGQLIGYAGNTGHSTGSHLHFAVKENGRAIDPSPYIEELRNIDKFTTLEKKEPIVDSGYSILDMLKFDEGTVTSFLKMLTHNFINFMS